MATTSRPITELTLGIRDATGAVVPSGKVRFYQPGTLTPESAFLDEACASAITPPLTLNAGGQATAYTLEATRMIVKDVTETTTYYDGIVNLNRHDAVYVTSPGINGGAETTLENVLADASESFGAGFKYEIAPGGVERNYVDVLSERAVSVKDFGAVGDGATNDYAAIQATIDYLAGLTRPGGIAYFPVGEYLINTGLSIVTAGISLMGAGRNLSVIKNGSTTNTAVTVSVNVVDVKCYIRDLGVTASTVSSGTAILFSLGGHPMIERVGISLHRTGIDCTSVSAAHLYDCYVSSTDDNASSLGLRVGARGRISNSEAITGTANGTGISLAGADATAEGCYTSAWSIGLSASATNTGFIRCTISAAVTGASLSGTASFFDHGRAANCTTGVSVAAAVASARVAHVTYSSNTTDLSVSSTATNFYEVGNWATLSAGTATNMVTPVRGITSTLTGTGTPTTNWTPVHGVNSFHHFRATNSGSVTIANMSGTNKMVGDVIHIYIFASSATLTVTFNSTAYKRPDGTTALASHGLGGSQEYMYVFVFDGTVYRLMGCGGTSGSQSPLG